MDRNRQKPMDANGWNGQKWTEKDRNAQKQIDMDDGSGTIAETSGSTGLPPCRPLTGFAPCRPLAPFMRAVCATGASLDRDCKTIISSIKSPPPPKKKN